MSNDKTVSQRLDGGSLTGTYAETPLGMVKSDTSLRLLYGQRCMSAPRPRKQELRHSIRLEHQTSLHGRCGTD